MSKDQIAKGTVPITEKRIAEDMMFVNSFVIFFLIVHDIFWVME
jgi:hypothetical protein